MSHIHLAESVEFVRLAGYPIRVTSLKRDENANTYRLIVVTRGTRDAEVLREILETSPLDLDIPNELVRSVAIAIEEIRSSGEGQTMATRFSLTIRPSDETASSPTLEVRVAALEREVAALQTTVRLLLEISRPEL